MRDASKKLDDFESPKDDAVEEEYEEDEIGERTKLRTLSGKACAVSNR